LKTDANFPRYAYALSTAWPKKVTTKMPYRS
jgi:hypothetical protein